jgi:predicted RNA-binding Zn ribbon-like protein
MTVSEFVSLVEKMREAQKRYFRTRASYNLNDSKKLEKQVDEAVEQWNKRQVEKQQPGLGLGAGA